MLGSLLRLRLSLVALVNVLRLSRGYLNKGLGISRLLNLDYLLGLRIKYKRHLLVLTLKLCSNHLSLVAELVLHLRILYYATVTLSLTFLLYLCLNLFILIRSSSGMQDLSLFIDVVGDYSLFRHLILICQLILNLLGLVLVLNHALH